MGNFKIWIDNPIGGTNVVVPETFEGETQRKNGFKAGTGASSILVNTALRQSNLVTTALMDVVGEAMGDTLSVLSPLEDVKDSLRSFMKNASTNIVYFSPSSAVTNISNGETIGVNFGRIQTYLSELDRRVTEAGFSEGSATLGPGISATLNKLTKQGHYAIFKFEGACAGDGGGDSGRYYITLPEGFIPNETFKMRVMGLQNGLSIMDVTAMTLYFNQHVSTMILEFYHYESGTTPLPISFQVGYEVEHWESDEPADRA